MDRLRLKAEGGFTLIELLVVIAIIGILAAIAIPQFSAYRRRGIDSDVKSNVKNLNTTQEAYFVDVQSYASGAGNAPAFSNRGFKQSSNVTVTATGSATGFVITGGATKGCGAGSFWSFDSNTGLLVGTACG
jgi:prepilin-type N-terminal cleavage/methylation domain-containing protein